MTHGLRLDDRSILTQDETVMYLRTTLAEPWRTRWFDYHREHARLQLLSKQAHKKKTAEERQPND